MIRGRLAPSPTGHLHLGNAWAFLLAWLGVRSKNGVLVLRIEDIDPDRSKAGFVEDLLKDLLWLGLDWDEGPMPRNGQNATNNSAQSLPSISLKKLSIRAAEHGKTAGSSWVDASDSHTQAAKSVETKASTPDYVYQESGPYQPYFQSRRLGHYQAFIEYLDAHGLSYPCYCTRKELKELASAPHGPQHDVDGLAYPGLCRNLSAQERLQKERQGKKAALRLRLPPEINTSFSIIDQVQGERHFTAADLGGDFAIQRSDGVVAYQMAVALDDIAMEINQVVRGRDILHCVPRQAAIYSLLGRQLPQYAHLPLLLDHEGQRLAKRHQSLSLQSLRNCGVKAENVIGYLAFLAGLLAHPRATSALELSNGFNFTALHKEDVLLPSDPEKILLSF